MKRLIILFSVILFAAGLLSCAKPAALPPVDYGIVSNLYEVETGSSVWKVSKDGNTIFLGGSIHILRESDFPLPVEFDLAFSQSDILVLEADVEQMEDENILMYLLSQMFLPEDRPLQSILNPDVYAILSDVCNEYGFSIFDVEYFKPSMIMNMLIILQMHELGFVQEGIDEYYLQKARNENKPVSYLESLESQIDMLVSMGEGYENEYVLYSLLDLQNTENEIDELLYDWKHGVSAYTNPMLIEMKEHWPLMYKALITNRHDAWMPQIIDFVASGKKYFVIVGLAHMYGPDGLLLQLSNLGYTIEKF